MKQNMLSIPVVADVERNVDGIEMIRCWSSPLLIGQLNF